MFLRDYGRWLELVQDDGVISWVSSADLPMIDLKAFKLIREYQSGDLSGQCWLTYSSNKNLLDRAFLVVDKEEEVNDAVDKALNQSRKMGGGHIFVGCFQGNSI